MAREHSIDFHVLLQESTLNELTKIAEDAGISRNFLINRVLKDFVQGNFEAGSAISTLYKQGEE